MMSSAGPGPGLRGASDTVTGCASPSFPPIRPGVAASPPSPPTSCTRSTRPIGSVRSNVAAIDERHVVRAYGREVRWRIRQGTPEGYAGAARAIAAPTSMSSASSTSSGSTGSGRTRAGRASAGSKAPTRITSPPFLEEVGKPDARHDAHRAPGAHARRPRRRAADRRGRRRPGGHGRIGRRASCDEVYGVRAPVSVIQHGMPHIEPKGRRRLKEKLGLDGRHIVVHVRPGGTGQGAGVRDRGDARGRGEASRRALPDRRPDPSGTAAASRRGVPQQADRDGRGAWASATTSPS